MGGKKDSFQSRHRSKCAAIAHKRVVSTACTNILTLNLNMFMHPVISSNIRQVEINIEQSEGDAVAPKLKL